MKILLVYPNNPISCDGFRLISAILRKEGHHIFMVTTPHCHEYDWSQDEILLLGEFTMNYDLVLMNIYSVHEPYAIRLTQHLRHIRPDRLIIWGGPHCISAPQKALHYADGVCYSEGDIALPQFVNMLQDGNPDYLNTPNMGFRVNGAIHINPTMPLVTDLDSLPFSDYSFENEWILDGQLIPVTPETFEKFSPRHPFRLPTLLFLSMRGCPHHCSYCNNVQYLNMYPHQKLRRQSVKRFLDEMQYVLRQLPNIRHISISDDDFFIRPENELTEFVEYYNRHINFPIGIALSANTFTAQKYAIFSKLAQPYFQMGVQSGSQRILQNIYDRNVFLHKVEKVIHHITPDIQTRKLRLFCDFIIDNPYETEADVYATYRFITRLPRQVHIDIFKLSFFPGTPLYERVLRERIITNPNVYHSGSFKSRDIQFQNNYPMLLLLVWESLRFTRRIPFWLIFPAYKPVRYLMHFMPRPFMAWLIKTLPRVIRKMVRIVKQIK